MKLTPEVIKIKGERVLRSCKTDEQLNTANEYITRMFMYFLKTKSPDFRDWYWHHLGAYTNTIAPLIKLFKLITFQVHSNLNNISVQENSYDDLDNLE